MEGVDDFLGCTVYSVLPQGKDLFRNGWNTQLSRILIEWTEMTHISPKPKYNLANLFENAFLSMPKLSWDYVPLPRYLLCHSWKYTWFNITPNSDSISRDKKLQFLVICQQMPVFEHLKNQLLANSKHVWPLNSGFSKKKIGWSALSISKEVFAQGHVHSFQQMQHQKP